MTLLHGRHSRPWLVHGVVSLLLMSLPCASRGDELKQKRFELVFGSAVRLDPELVEKVKALPPGERLRIDVDQDGLDDEEWFIDTSLRHTDDVRPLLVRVIDEDGDLDTHLGPDLDSDLYVVDWKADGTVDVVLDYQDNDSDQDLDEMAFYFWMPRHHYFGENALGVWWGSDDGDDNLLWYDVNYTYYQNLCQYRCHFSGDESFVAFGLPEGAVEWVSGWENPFLFYDPDDDRCSEVVLRIEGLSNQVRAIRYSFDADDDAFGRRTHDYDFSITARAEEDKPVILPDDGVTRTTLRDIPTQPWLRRDVARAFVEQAQWHRAVLTWDEMNANTDQNVERDPHERWEGVIAQGSEHFQQVGGPPCSKFNKRNEVSLKPITPMKLYWDKTDRKLHLLGANEGWLQVDFDLNGVVDATCTYIDEDQDGVFDRRRLDVDADGEIDFDWPMANRAEVDVIELDWRALSTFYRRELASVLADSQAFIDAVKSHHGIAFGEEPVDPAETFFLDQLESWMPETRLGAYMRKTPAGARLYVELVRDRLLLAFKRRHLGGDEEYAKVEALCAQGNHAEAAEAVRQLTLIAAPYTSEISRRPSVVEPYKRSLEIRVSTRGDTDQTCRDLPVAIPVSRLKAVDGWFDVSHCAVVSGERWLDYRLIPHQVDQPGAAGEEEISFLVDAQAGAPACRIYYAATAATPRAYPVRTATAEDWVPPNIGWESTRVGYRAYWGQFDFFGKKMDTLIMPTIGRQSYHGETDWGIDALHVGTASGIGGLTLYIGDEPVLLQNPAGKGDVEFTKRVITAGPVRAVVEMTATPVLPDKTRDITVRMICIVYADRQETEVRARVEGAEGRQVTLAPGLIKLSREQVFATREHGCFGTWGWQQHAIGEIGMAVIVEPGRVADVLDLPEEHRIRCRTDDHELRYWVIGDWRRGRQHPIAPSVDTWREEVCELADGLVSSIEIIPEADVNP